MISLATSDCHSAADALTSNTAPVVMEARNVMMATTATSARPEIEARGTIGDMLRACAGDPRAVMPEIDQRNMFFAGSSHQFAWP